MENKVTSELKDANGLRLEGIWKVELFNSETGEKELEHVQKNIIVDNAIVHMCHGYGPGEFSNLHIGGVGSGGATLGNIGFPSTPNVTQTDLDAGAAAFVCTTAHLSVVQPGVFSFEKKASLATTDAVGTLTEAGLFTTDGVMLNRILFNPQIVKTNQQTAFITTTIQIRRV